MKASKLVSCAVIAVALGCAHTSRSGADATVPARGVLRVTNNGSESIQVFATANGTDTYLRQVQPGTSESFQVENTSPGQTIYLKAKTTSGREYTSPNGIPLAAKVCARNYGDASLTPSCDWRVP